MAVLNWREVTDEEYGVIGNPIAHSWSPRLFKAAFEAAGLPYRYIAIQCDHDEFEEAIAFLSTRMRGLNVTAPFKNRVAAAVGKTAPWPINVIRFERLNRLMNCDVVGLLAAFQELSLSGNTLVLGSGGAAESACIAIRLSTKQQVFNWNRRGIPVDDSFFAEPSAANFDIVINATGAAPTFDWSGNGTAYDLSYGESPTSFMQEAMSHGWRAFDGRLMLLHQAICSFGNWFDKPAPEKAMREALP